MSKLRSLNTSFWSDPWIEDLSPIEKLLFVYLITNEKTNMLGIYEASIKKISFETGIEKDDIKKAFEGFERIGKVKYINNHIVLVNFMKHQNYNTNMKKSAIDVYNNLPKDLKIKGLEVNKDKPLEGFERLLKAFGMVRKVEVEYEEEVEDEKEIELEAKISPKKTFNNLTNDSFYSVDELAKVYLKDEKLISLVAKHTNRNVDDLKNLMPEFVEKLKTENRGIETPGEFAKYFKNILKGNFKLNIPAPKINASEEYCWTWKGQPKIYGSLEKYEADKKTWDQPGFGFETLKTPNV